MQIGDSTNHLFYALNFEHWIRRNTEYAYVRKKEQCSLFAFIVNKKLGKRPKKMNNKKWLNKDSLNVTKRNKMHGNQIIDMKSLADDRF